MAKFKVGDKVKAIPAIAAVSAPKMKGRVWTVTAVVAGGRRVDLESNGEKLSGVMETALIAANSVLSRNSVVNAALARKQGVAVAANASSADADKSAASTARDVLAALKDANLDRLSNAGDELSSYAAHLDFILPDCTGPYRLKVEKLGREISAFCAKLNDLDRRAKAVAQAASAIR